MQMHRASPLLNEAVVSRGDPHLGKHVPSSPLSLPLPAVPGVPLQSLKPKGQQPAPAPEDVRAGTAAFASLMNKL